MKIVVTTPTGNVGHHVVAGLVRAGIRPTVLVRDPGRLDPLIADAVDAVTVDLSDGDAVVAATRGADGLFWVSPMQMVDDPIGAYVAFGRVAARAVTENRIARTVFQSSIGAEKKHGVGEIDGLAATEDLLGQAVAQTGGALLSLRCGYFFSNLLMALDDLRAGQTAVILPVDLPLAWVAPRDIAEVAVSRLLVDWSGVAVQAVHGPADLSWEQAAAIIAEAVGRPFVVERISDDEQRAGMRSAGLSEGLIDGLMGMSTGMRDDFVPDQRRDATTTTPTTLGAWAYAELRPLLRDAAGS